MDTPKRPEPRAFRSGKTVDLEPSPDQPDLDTADKSRSGTIKKRLLLLFLPALALAVVWRYTPFAEWFETERVTRWAGAIRKSPAAPLLVIGAYLLGGAVMFPVTLLIGATAWLFDPIPGMLYSIAGILASGLAMYGVGSRVDKSTIGRALGKRLGRLSKKIGKAGLLLVIAFRIVPVGPFSLVNLAAGASHIRVRDLVLGTILGTAPAIMAITLLTSQVEGVARIPIYWRVAFLTAVSLSAALVYRWVNRRSFRGRISHKG